MSTLAPSPQPGLPQHRVTVEEMNETVAISDSTTAIISFACPLPSDILSSIPGDDDVTSTALPVNLASDIWNQGVVGTITLLGSSLAMIWFSWGRLIPHEFTDNTTASIDQSPPTGPSMVDANAVMGQASNRSMGPLVVAMPRSDFTGAFASSKPSSSKLISHGSSVEAGGMTNEMMASQIAERLSQRLGMAIFVSCSLEDTPSLTGCEGIMEQHVLRSRAGALAEKEVARLLRNRNISPNSSST